MRTLEEVNKEYTETCIRAGHTQYQIYAHKKALDLLNEKLVELNLEAAKVSEESKKAAEEAKKEA